MASPTDKKSDLPIQECLPDLLKQLSCNPNIVLQAPPGAGKTTQVPLALLNQTWLGSQKIIMLEPRRIAALNAAKYMASLLNEEVGETVGYKMRGATKVSAKTRIEVITEGLLTRQLQTDPELTDIGVIIFDEFHERSIHTDTGLALCLQSQELFRETPLKLVVMSATLDEQAIAKKLNNAPIITSQGRSFPINTHYLDKPIKSQNQHRIFHHSSPHLFDTTFLNTTISTIEHALQNETGSILVFLPGVREIRQVQNNITQKLNKNTDCFVLYGNLSLQEQQKAIQPAPINKRKIVLTTDIAQTSLTIEGVRVVIDTGLVRSARYNANTDVTYLHTHTISQASSDQRQGRAGRKEPGSCYRLWTKSEQTQKAKQPTPQILKSDLTDLALTLIQWGVDTPEDLTWLDVPPQGHWQQALQTLEILQAINKKNALTTSTLTATGELMSNLPCHPRIARLLIAAKKLNACQLGVALAVILSEKKTRETSIDIEQNLLYFCHKDYTFKENAPKKMTQLALTFNKILNKKVFNNINNNTEKNIHDNITAGFILAFSHPDKIAKKKTTTQEKTVYQLANGRAAFINQHENITQSDWIIAVDSGGFSNSKEDIIYSAVTLNENLFKNQLSVLINKKISAKWDEEKNKLIAKEQYFLQKILLYYKNIHPFPKDKKQTALANLVKDKGLNLFNITSQAEQLIARVNLLHKTLGDPWPDYSSEALINNLSQWLLPYLDNINTLADFKKLDITQILKQNLAWPLPKELDALAPEKIDIPSGRKAHIDYTQNPPVLAVKLQEMFGCNQNPSVINKRVTLSIHLLSPAKRPLQITQDIQGFWKSSYQDVKKEMKGRYPKHPWPDDPINFKATALTKNKLNNH